MGFHARCAACGAQRPPIWVSPGKPCQVCGSGGVQWVRIASGLVVLACSWLVLHLMLRAPRPAHRPPPRPLPAQSRTPPPPAPARTPPPAPTHPARNVVVLRELPGRAAGRVERTLSAGAALELPTAALLVDEVLIEAHWCPGAVRGTELVVEAARAGGTPEEAAPPSTRWEPLAAFPIAPRSMARYRARASAAFDRLRLSVRGARARVFIRDVIALPPGQVADAADALRTLAIERDDASGVMLSDASSRGLRLPAGSLSYTVRAPMAAVGHRQHDTILRQFEWDTYNCDVLRLRDSQHYGNGGSTDMLLAPAGREWVRQGLGDVTVDWMLSQGAAALARRWRCEAPVDWVHDDALGITAHLLPSGLVNIHRDDSLRPSHYKRPGELPANPAAPAEARFLEAVRARFEKNLAGRKTICTVEWASSFGEDEAPAFEVLMVTEYVAHVRRVDISVTRSRTIVRTLGETFSIPRHFLPPVPLPAVGRKLHFRRLAAPLPERTVTQVRFELTGARGPPRPWPSASTAPRETALKRAGPLAWATPRFEWLTPSRNLELSVPIAAACLLLEVDSRQNGIATGIQPVEAAPARLLVETRAAGGGAWDKHAPITVWPWAGGWVRLDAARPFDRIRLSCDGPDAELRANDVVALPRDLPPSGAREASRAVTVTRVTPDTVTVEANGARAELPVAALSPLPPECPVICAAPDAPVILSQGFLGMVSTSWTKSPTATGAEWDFSSGREHDDSQPWRGKPGYRAVAARAVTFLPAERLFEPALELAALRYPNGRLRFVRGAGDDVAYYDPLSAPIDLPHLIAALEGREVPHRFRNVASEFVRSVGAGAPAERLGAWLREVVLPRWGNPSPPAAPGARYRISWPDGYGHGEPPGGVRVEALPPALLPEAPPPRAGGWLRIERLD